MTILSVEMLLYDYKFIFEVRFTRTHWRILRQNFAVFTLNGDTLYLCVEISPLIIGLARTEFIRINSNQIWGKNISISDPILKKEHTTF